MQENKKITERENVLRLFRGEKPLWFPESERSMKWVLGRALDDLERPHYADGTDWFGVEWKVQDSMGVVGITHPNIYQEPILEDMENWQEYIKFPNLDEVDWDLVRDGILESAKTVNDRMTFCYLEHGAFERLTLLMGFENALVALLDDPEACHEYAEAMADFKIEIFDRLMDIFPYEMIIYQDDIGSDHGALMSLDTYREIFKGPLKRVIDHVHARGVYFGYHSCGKMEAFMDDLLEIGIDYVNPVQYCNDQAAFVEKYGNRLVIEGGLNNQEVTDVLEPNEEALRAEIRRAVDVFGPCGRFVLRTVDTSMAINGLDVRGVQYDEFDKYTKGYYD